MADGDTCARCGQVHSKCHSHARSGKPCRGNKVDGADRCRLHLGGDKARAKAAVVAEVRRWGLGDSETDPGTVLLRLVTQSAARVERYSQMLEEAYEAAETLRAHHEAGALLTLDEGAAGNIDLDGDDTGDNEPPDIQIARDQLDRIFTTGGVAALVGHTYAASQTGHVYATGEAIRGLAKLEAEERDRCAGFAAKAVAAGLAKRQIELAESQGRLIADVLRSVLGDDELGLTGDQRKAAPGVIRRHLTAIGG